MRIENSFLVPAPIDQVWDVLLDVPRVAPCVPGAQLTEVLGGDRYRGQAAVKLGPVQLLFGGEAQLSAVNSTAHSARITAKGSDRKGRGAASAVMNFNLAAENEVTTRVNVETDLTLTGSVAQYGRATGLVKEVANELVRQFSTNFGGLLAENPVAASKEQKLSNHQAVGLSAAVRAVEDERPVHDSQRPDHSSSAPIGAFRLLFIAATRAIGGSVMRLFGRKR